MWGNLQNGIVCSERVVVVLGRFAVSQKLWFSIRLWIKQTEAASLLVISVQYTYHVHPDIMSHLEREIKVVSCLLRAIGVRNTTPEKYKFINLS